MWQGILTLLFRVLCAQKKQRPLRECSSGHRGVIDATDENNLHDLRQQHTTVARNYCASYARWKYAVGVLGDEIVTHNFTREQMMQTSRKKNSRQVGTASSKRSSAPHQKSSLGARSPNGGSMNIKMLLVPLIGSSSAKNSRDLYGPCVHPNCM